MDRRAGHWRQLPGCTSSGLSRWPLPHVWYTLVMTPFSKCTVSKWSGPKFRSYVCCVRASEIVRDRARWSEIVRMRRARTRAHPALRLVLRLKGLDGPLVLLAGGAVVLHRAAHLNALGAGRAVEAQADHRVLVHLDLVEVVVVQRRAVARDVDAALLPPRRRLRTRARMVSGAACGRVLCVRAHLRCLRAPRRRCRRSAVPSLHLAAGHGPCARAI